MPAVQSKGDGDKEDSMNRILIAMPVEKGRLSGHFGRCREFVFFTGDVDAKAVIHAQTREAPPHEPGAVPKWLLDHGVTLVVAGHLGGRAQEILEEGGCRVVAGAPDLPPEELARLALEGRLEERASGCCGAHEDGEEGGCGCGH